MKTMHGKSLQHRLRLHTSKYGTKCPAHFYVESSGMKFCITRTVQSTRHPRIRLVERISRFAPLHGHLQCFGGFLGLSRLDFQGDVFFTLGLLAVFVFVMLVFLERAAPFSDFFFTGLRVFPLGGFGLRLGLGLGGELEVLPPLACFSSASFRRLLKIFSFWPTVSLAMIIILEDA